MAQIQRLPPDVAAQIKASARLCSLNSVIVGLLENALDAGAQKIDIKVDFARASCWIRDDGNGIAASSFAEDGGLGEPFHTSNIHGATTFLGSSGLFLASVAAVSILSITSRCQSSPQSNAIIWRYAQSATRLLPAPEHMSLELGDHGTKVSVHDLFGNMPVRVKQRPSSDEDRRLRDKEWSSLCIAITGCILAHGEPLHLTMKGKDNNHGFNIKVKQYTEKRHASLLGTSSRLCIARSVLQQAFPSVSASTWIPISARTSTLHFQTIIHSDAIPQRHLQFICIGNRYMPPDGACEVLYESVNQVFSNSSFGRVDLETQIAEAKDYTKQYHQASRLSFKHWPAFVMLVKFNNSPEAIHDHNQRDFFSRLSEIATTLVTRFLTEHGYRSRKSTPTQKGFYEAQQESTLQPISLDKSKLDTQGLRHPTSRRFLSSTNPFQEMDFDIKLSTNQSMPTDIPLKDAAVFRSRFMSSCVGKRFDSHSSHSRPILPMETYSTKGITNLLGLKNPVVDALHENTGAFDAMSTCDETGLQMVQACEPKSNRDPSFRWTDSRTRKTFCINARTGFIVKSGDYQRPETTNDSTTQLARSRSRYGSLPRITRSTDGIAPPKNNTWAKQFLENWHNPILENVQTNASAPESCFHNFPPPAPVADDSSLFSHILKDQSMQSELRLQRTSLRKAVVVSQVDSKFILAKMYDSTMANSKDMVVLVDQHAADERIRVEELLKQLCSAPGKEVAAYVSPLQQKSAVDTIILQQPIVLEVQSQERELFKRSASHFAQWGILYNISPSSSDPKSTISPKFCQLIVLSLPSAIAQRCSFEPRLLLNLLRGEVWKEEERATPKHHNPDTVSTNWVTRLRSCPSGILHLVNSRACRSAVMFNDVLTLVECKKIVSDLAECQFPFQCAHGRPSMVPLLEINETEATATTTTAAIDEPDDFSTAWRSWIGRE